MIGKRISHYRILELIRDSSMGTVYKAEDLNLERLVAVKIVKPSSQDRVTANHLFMREAQAIARIDHPNVVALHEILHEGDEYYLVMQFIPGDSLREVMRARPASPAEALAIACQVGAGLKAAHDLGIVHRDIKPENIMATPTGQYKILDFGVAHLADRSTLTDLSRIIGTLPYMAPEQMRGESADARTDIYALGVLLYELMAGRLPFEAEVEAVLFYQILNREPPDPTTLRPDLPEGVARVIAHALRKNRDERYQTIDEMLHDLELIRASIAEPAFAPGRALLARRRPLPRWLLWVGASAAVGLAVLGFLAVKPLLNAARTPRILVMRWDETPPRPESEWLSGGIMDCMIRALGNREGFGVISRQTVAATLRALRPAGAEDARAASMTAAHRLGAAYLVTGTVEPLGAGARISCELTDVNTGLLATSWSRQLADVRGEFYAAVEGLASDVASWLGDAARRRPREARSVAQVLTPSIDALMHYHQALEYHELRNDPAAVDELRLALGVDSTFVEANLLLAQLAREHGEMTRSLVLAMRYRDRASAETRRLVEAMDLVFHGRIEDAVRKYQEVLADDPENVMARSSLAIQLATRRRFEEAVAEYSLLRGISPYDYSFYPYLAADYIEIGRKDKALALLQAWHKEFPRERAPLRELISTHEALGNYGAALALCDTLDQVAPGSAIASRGFLLSYLGRLNQADSLFHSLLDSPDRYSSSSRAYSYLAWVAFRRQHYAQGLALMKPALEQQPETYNFWIAGLLAAGQRDTAFANRCLQAIAGEFGGARDDSAVTEAYGARRFFHHLRGTIAICAGRPAEAARMYEQALRYVGQGDGPFFRTAYGRALLESGQIGRSIQELGRVLAFNPNYPEALLYLGRAYAQAGQRAQARRVLEQLGVLWKGADRDDPLNQERLKLMSQVSSPSPGPHAVLPRARPGTGL